MRCLCLIFKQFVNYLYCPITYIPIYLISHISYIPYPLYPISLISPYPLYSHIPYIPIYPISIPHISHTPYIPYPKYSHTPNIPISIPLIFPYPYPISIPLFEALLQIGWVLDHKIAEVLDIDALVGLLPDLQLPTVLAEQVSDLLIVQLQKTGAHKILNALSLRVDVLEYMVECPGYNALKLIGRLLAFHGERLAGARLPIREYGAIVALQHAFDDPEGGVLIHLYH